MLLTVHIGNAQFERTLSDSLLMWHHATRFSGVHRFDEFCETFGISTRRSIRNWIMCSEWYTSDSVEMDSFEQIEFDLRIVQQGD